jgi:hypothetical protein
MALKTILRATFAVPVILGLASSADAQSRKGPRGEGQAVVTSCSNYGNGCQSAPIRRGTYDYEFRMPGGTWVPCQQNCKDTLRREVIDFWETQRENGGSNVD